jgi:hypothetical protein
VDSLYDFHARLVKLVADETEDPGLGKLLRRLRDHGKYHAEVFSDLLKEEEKQG